MCIWCGLHQVDLVAQQEYEALSNDTFVLMLTGLIAYLHCQQNLQTEMKMMCPKFMSTQWLLMKHVISWLKMHHVQVTQYLDAKRPAYMPKLHWWIALLCLDSVATVLSLTVSRLQGLHTFLLQQEAEVIQLCASLSEMCKIDCPFLAEQVMTIDMVTALSQGLYAVAFVNAKTFIQDQGTFLIDILETIPPESTAAITWSIANLFAVITMRGSNNNQSSMDAL